MPNNRIGRLSQFGAGVSSNESRPESAFKSPGIPASHRADNRGGLPSDEIFKRMTIDSHKYRIEMCARVSIAEAKASFASLIARAEAGEKILVTRNGRPVACVGPLIPERPIPYGDLREVPLADDLSLSRHHQRF
jgi:prevent-host-death family protein